MPVVSAAPPADTTGIEAKLRDHCQGTMGYLERNIDKRLDPRLLVEDARSIISVALNYYPPVKLPGRVPQFAYYAYGKDYHDVVREKLRQLYDWIRERHPGVTGRCFTDSAPVLERFWAAQAGFYRQEHPADHSR